MKLLLTFLITTLTESKPELIDYIYIYWLLGAFNEKKKEIQSNINKILNNSQKDNFSLELSYTSQNLIDIGVADQMTPINVDFNKYKSAKMQNLIDKQFKKLTNQISNQILNALNTADMTEVENLLAKIQKKENVSTSVISGLMRIYRTENTAMRSQVKLDIQLELEKQGIIVKRKWLHTLDNPMRNYVNDDYKPREDHLMLNGAIEDSSGYFHTVNGSTKAPGLFGIPSEDINCRCDTEFVL